MLWGVPVETDEGKNMKMYTFSVIAKMYVLHCTTLYAEQILNKIANTFDGTYAGLKSMLQRFRIYFA